MTLTVRKPPVEWLLCDVVDAHWFHKRLGGGVALLRLDLPQPPPFPHSANSPEPATYPQIPRTSHLFPGAVASDSCIISR
jgi:hypothetical protein